MDSRLRGNDSGMVFVCRSLITEDLSREAASEWAQKNQDAEDTGNLEFDPPLEEKRIWNAILYLTGVDMKRDPESYLHSVEDFAEY